MDLLQAFGAPKDSCIDLCDSSDVRSLRYTDLVRNRKTPVVDYIVEQQSQALLYVIDQTHFNQVDISIPNLQRILAMRGDPAWLGVLKPGRLDIYATDLQPALDSEPVWFSQYDHQALSVLPRLAQGENLAPTSTLRLRDELLRLMTNSGEALRDLGLSTDEIIALTGRALFFRYLIGRKIVGEDHLSLIAPSANSLSACFDTCTALAETNLWLDQTFNGDLLALPSVDYVSYFRLLLKKHGHRVVQPLSSIMTLDTAIVPGVSQQKLDWGDLDFDHLPIGLLSETYEELMYRFDASARHSTSVYYTPYHIAEYMVEEAFHEHQAGSKARMLDPACGAGVFLVAGFRKLVELLFRETGRRPSRPEIRSILNNQLVGFDTNSHARTLAALALYLTALELDPLPAPVEALKFNKLEDSVLIDVADPNSRHDGIVPMIGSLGAHILEKYKNAFDVVIGNPPWTSLTAKYAHIDNTFTQRCREIASRRGLETIAENYHNPDRVPDLPFVWGAMEWAKPGGRIALALAGRWLFKQSLKGVEARNALFSSLKITGVLNGASLRQTRVWPNVDQPFCLLFADNVLPEFDDEFVFLSPFCEPKLNDKGLLRIDANDAKPVSMELVTSKPWILKALYRGTVIDISIISRIQKSTEITVGSYWESHLELNKGQGFQVASRAMDDSFLIGKPELQADYNLHPFVVIDKRLSKYIPQGLHRPRLAGIYKGPLVLIRKALRHDRDRGRALYSDVDIAYSESYYGYSSANYPQGRFLSLYLLALMHSELFEYFSLMTSGEFGVEREAQQVIDIDRFPFIPPEELSLKQRKLIEKCAEKLIDGDPDWETIDRTIASLYGLADSDCQVITEVLAFNSPYAAARSKSLDEVSKEQVIKYLSNLQSELSSVFSAGGHSVLVQELDNPYERLPWKFFTITLDGADSSHALPINWINCAHDLGASRITLIDSSSSCLTVGLLNLCRYWMPSNARLVASDILWEFGVRLEENAK